MANNTKSKLLSLQQAQRFAKSFIDANVWDGEDRAGATGDICTHTPDELQELVDKLLEYIFENEVKNGN